MREVYEITLPISGEEADVIGMPAEYFERAVKRLGRLTRLEGVVVNTEAQLDFGGRREVPSITTGSTQR